MVGSVTLNVNVVGSVTLDVEIVGSTVALDVRITASTVTLNVNITGSTVTLNVNVTNTYIDVRITASTVTLNVNITGSTVTLNVNVTNATINIAIQSQAIDLKIYTPTGRWTTISQTVVTTAVVDSKEAGAGQEVTVISVTGRGRLMNIGIYFFYTAGTPASIYGNAWINIYVDGSLKLSLNPARLDRMTGYMVDMLRQALCHALFTGISIPYNISRIGTNPDRYLIRPENVNPKGSLTWAVYNYTNSRYESMGGFINVDEEFFSSLEVKLKNDETAATLAVAVVAMVGEYP
ncbi:MAG: hypothetical protein QXX41_02980 [Nitrososphaerota archaeon]